MSTKVSIHSYEKLANSNDGFIHAAISGDFKTIVKLLETIDNPNMLDEEEMSALHWAAAYDEPRIVSSLLKDSRIEPNIQGHRKMTPLHKASTSGALQSIKVLLKDSRIQVDALNEWKETPLFLAAHNGDARVCFLLLKAGSDKSIQDNWGSTAMEAANSHGFPLLAQMIEDFSDEMDEKSILNYLPKRITPIKSAPEVSQNLSVKKRILSKLMEAPLRDDDFLSWMNEPDVDINGRDMYKWTAMHKLAAWNKSNCLENLLQHELLSDFHPSGQNGDTPFHAAIEMGSMNCLDVLLACSKTCEGINIANDDGKIPLHTAVLTGDINCIKKLLESKANPSLRDYKDQLTPFQLSKSLPSPYKENISGVLLEYISNCEDKDNDNANSILGNKKKSNLPEHYGMEERKDAGQLDMEFYQKLNIVHQPDSQ